MTKESKIRITAIVLSILLAVSLIVYAVMLFGYGLGCVRAVQMSVIHIMRFGEKELSTVEQTMADAAQEAAAGGRGEGEEA